MTTNKHYKNIIIAIDFSDSGKQIIERALELAKGTDTKLTLLHVVEYYPLIGIGADLPTAYNWDVPHEELLKGAEISLDYFIKKYSLNDINKVVSFGPTHIEIVSYAKGNKADLIIIGSHGRHGVGLLLGSTANGVLHHAECDVLAVRIRK